MVRVTRPRLFYVHMHKVSAIVQRQTFHTVTHPRYTCASLWAHTEENYVSVTSYTHISTCICTYMHMCSSMYVYTYACLWKLTWYTYLCTYEGICIHVHMCVGIPIYMLCTHTCTYWKTSRPCMVHSQVLDSSIGAQNKEHNHEQTHMYVCTHRKYIALA